MANDEPECTNLLSQSVASISTDQTLKKWTISSSKWLTTINNKVDQSSDKPEEVSLAVQAEVATKIKTTDTTKTVKPTKTNEVANITTSVDNKTREANEENEETGTTNTATDGITTKISTEKLPLKSKLIGTKLKLSNFRKVKTFK